MKRIISLLLCFPLMAGDSWKPSSDKRSHFIAGFAIGVGVSVAFRWTGGSPKQSCRIGFGLGVMEGVRKEVYDHQSNVDANSWGLKPVHSVSGADLAYTVAGAALGSYLTYKVMEFK